MADEVTAIDKNIGNNILRFRADKDMSQAQLAEAMTARAGYQIHQQTVFKIEKGTRPLRYSEAVLIADVLGVPISALAAPADPASYRFGEILFAIKHLRESLSELTKSMAQYLRAVASLAELVNQPVKGNPDYLIHASQLASRLMNPDLISAIQAAYKAAADADGQGPEGNSFKPSGDASDEGGKDAPGA